MQRKAGEVSRWWQLKHFWFSHIFKLGKWSNLTFTFFKGVGWTNHQLGMQTCRDVMGFLLCKLGIWSPRPKSVSWYRQQHGPVPGTQRWMDPIESPGVSQGKTFKLWMFNGSNEGNSMQRRSKNFRKLPLGTLGAEKIQPIFHSEKLEVNIPVVLQLLISAFP